MRTPLRVVSALATCLVLLLSACERGTSPASPVDDPPDDVTVDGGILGTVQFWEGNFMPPGPSPGTVTTVVRELRIHELTWIDEVEPPGYGCFYSEAKTPLVAVVVSGDDGLFEVALAPGEYSLFVVEDGLLYTNRFGGGGSIQPVTVEPGVVTEVPVDITYASYW